MILICIREVKTGTCTYHLSTEHYWIQKDCCSSVKTCSEAGCCKLSELGSGNVENIFLLLKYKTLGFVCSQNSDLFYCTKENQMVENTRKNNTTKTS